VTKQQPSIEICLHSKRLLLRTLQLTDAKFILELLNSEAWLKYIGNRNLKSIADAENYISQSIWPGADSTGLGMLVVLNLFDNQPMGICGLIKREGLEANDIGFAFLPAFTGNGYALESAKIVLDYAHKKLGLLRIQAITTKENETSSHYVKWSLPRGGSYMHTLLLYHNYLYNVNWNGSVFCFDPLTGKEIYNAKLGKTKSFIASPVASDGKIFIVDEEGTVYIIRDGDKFDLLAEIPLNDICLTAPAITDGMIIFRTQKYLIAVGKK